MVVKDFEIAGIHFSGSSLIKIIDVVVGPNLRNVLLRGSFDNLLSLTGYLRTLVENGDVCGKNGVA